MTSWMKERDRLVERTLAFVQGVAAQRPAAAPKVEAADLIVSNEVTQAMPSLPSQMPAHDDEMPGLELSVASQKKRDASAAEADELMSLIARVQASSEPAAPLAALETAASVEAGEPIRTAAANIYIPKPKHQNEIMLPEREVISQRVERFRAGQQKMIREREDQYALTQAKIRATLGNDPRP